MGRWPEQIRFESLRLSARVDLDEPPFNNSDLVGDSEFREWCKHQGIVMDHGHASVQAGTIAEGWQWTAHHEEPPPSWLVEVETAELLTDAKWQQTFCYAHGEVDCAICEVD